MRRGQAYHWMRSLPPSCPGRSRRNKSLRTRGP
jgi:hypothetical protein